jgi:hypothetical protein
VTKMSNEAALAAHQGIRAEAERLAFIAERTQMSYLAYLAEVLSAEVDERGEHRRQRRIAEALPARQEALGLRPQCLAFSQSGDLLAARQLLVPHLR